MKCPKCGAEMKRGFQITDYKLWGSFRVAKALGIEETGKEPHPTEVYKTTSKYGKEGSPKMIPVFKQVPEKADNWEAELQLNRYRVMLEELGLTVHEMRLQITVRDGGLYIAHNRGVYKNIYKIPVRRVENYNVQAYFQYKSDQLGIALMDNEYDIPCNNQESWGGVRCREYCDVADFCPKGKLIKAIEGGK